MHPLQYLKIRHNQRQLLKKLSEPNFGLSSKQVERLSEEIHLSENFADRKPKEGETYYYYSGPLDEKTRPFCKRILEMDKVFASIDIEILSNYLGYDVFDSSGTFGPGAFNCRHHWVKFKGKRIFTPPVTVRQIKDLVSKGINLK